MSPDEQDGDRGNAHLSVGAPHGGSTADLHRTDPAVLDADLLFHAEFKRVGDDLKLVGSDGRTHIVAGYFETENPRALLTPDGAALSGDVVAALAGPAHPGQYAALQAPQGATPVIGHAARIEGYVSVVRNGVAITLNNGDVLLKGDVVQTAGEGVAGLVFNDGSAFQIGHDSRLVLSEFSYDSHGTANLELFNLVQGSFSFASGNIAHSGDMRIGTPAGSARITGSAGGGEIGANDGAVSLSIFHQDDGLHQATAFDRDGNPIATISSDGGRLTLTQNGPSQFTVNELAKTAAEIAAELDALNDILQLKGFAERFGSVTPGALGVHGSSSPPSDFHDLGFGSLGFKSDGLFGHNPFDNFIPFDGLFHPGSGNEGVAGLPASIALLFIDPPPVLSSGATADVNEGVAAHTAVYKATAADAIRATISYSLVLGLHDDAAAFSIDASTGVVTINATPDFETKPSYHFTVEASDPFGVSSTRAVTLSINDLAPVIRSGATAAVNEAVAAHSTVYTAVTADPAGGTVTYSLVSGLHDDASAFTINASTGVVTINNVPDFEAKPSYAFTVKASDSSGDFTTQAVTLSINDLPPVISSGAVATAIDEAAAAHMAVYTAEAADPAGGTVTWSLVSGLNDDAAFSIDASTGVVTINNAPNFEAQPSYAFTVKASDPSGHFTTQTVTLAVNDLPPVISSSATAAVDEAVAAHSAVYTAVAADPAGGTVTYALVSGLNDAAAAFSIDRSTGVVTINDVPNFEAQPSYAFTVKASDPSGDFTIRAVTLAINDLPPVISSAASADVDEAVVAQTAVYTAIAADPAGGTVTYALVAGLHDDASAFHIDASTGIVTINDVPNFEAKPSYTFTIEASDDSGKSTVEVVTLSINDLPPVISSGAVATAIDEATAAHTAVYTAAAADPAGGAVTYSLVTGLNDDAAAFSIDLLSGVVTINNVPDFETKPSYTFTVEASDPSGKLTVEAVTLSINDLPPVISSGALATALDEGSAAGTPVYTATATDPAGGSVTYALVLGLNDDAADFTIDATGVVTINDVADFETKPSYTFTVQATDHFGKSTVEAVTLSINDLPPAISSGAVAAAIDEGSAAGTLVYTASAADPVGGAVTYSLVRGADDDAAFSIDATSGVVTLNAIPDFEAKPSYTFTVKASDTFGQASTQTVTLDINDLPPVISSGTVATAINEGVLANTAVYTATAADPAGGIVTYSLLTGVNDDAAFSIDASSGVVTIKAVPDFETKPSYTFTVKANDTFGHASTQTVTLAINDLPPVFSSSATAAVNEGALALSQVYTAVAADPGGSAMTYSLVPGLHDDATAFSIDRSSGVVTINAIPDFETKPSYSFTVQASDASGHASTQTVTLTITDLPSMISSGTVAAAINEGVAAHTVVYTAIAADPAGGAVTYSLAPGVNDNAAFSINATSGVVTLNAIPDFEAKPSYTFTVKASDTFGQASTQTVTLDINDLPPVISSGTVATAINEGVLANTAVYTATAADPAGGTVRYSLVPGVNDDAAFSIDASSGVVKINAIPNFQSKSSYTFTVQASDPFGASAMQTVTLAIKDVPPVISGDLAISFYQGTSTTLTTADLTASGGSPTFHVTGAVHGHLELSGAPGTTITTFTEAQLAAGSVLFVSDGGAAASFTVVAIDGTVATAPVTINAAVSSDLVLPGDINLAGISETIHSLTQAGATLSGTGTLTDAGVARFTGGIETGGGTTIVDGAATLFSADRQVFTLDNRTLELAGSGLFGAFAADALYINNGARFIIDVGATFTDASVVTPGSALSIASYSGIGSFTVAGSYLKTGSGTTHIALDVTNSGIIDDQSGKLDIAGNVINNGALKVEGGGSLILEGAVTGTGVVSVGNDGSVEFGSSVSAGQTVSFNGTPGLVKIYDTGNFAGTIANFNATTDAIDLVGWDPGFFDTVFFANGVLTLSGGNGTASLHISGPTFGFNVNYDSTGTGTLITPGNVFVVHNATELDNALRAVSVGGSAAGNAHNAIQFAANISISTLGTNLSAINIAGGSDLTINGAGFTLDGANTFRGLFAFGGNIAIDDLNISHMLAQGGAGGDAGGGGGAGLGGGLFVGATASVSVTNVNFSSDRAAGGAGGQSATAGGRNYGGGGGGMGTAGITNDGRSTEHDSGQSQIWDGVAGGTLGLNVPGHSNYAQAAPGGKWLGGSVGNSSPAGNGAFGEGGGSGLYGRINTNNATYLTRGGDGGFGGGGGSGSAGSRSSLNSVGGTGGFGGGGGGNHTGGAGGYGAGAGGSFNRNNYSDGGGGGGLGAGGAIFVQDGGHLTFAGGSESGGSVAGGAGGYRAGGGLALGAGIFIQGNDTTITFAPQRGDSLTISDAIADQNNNGGSGNVEIAGAGIVHFAGANSYQGKTLIDAGATLDIEVGGTIGGGAVTDNGVLNINTTTTVNAGVTDGGVLNVNAATTFNAAVTDGGILNVGATTTFGGTVGVTGTMNVNASATFVGVVTDSGTLNINAATTFDAGVVDSGILNVNASTHFLGAVTDNGTVNVNAAAEFAGSLTGGGTLNFTPGQPATALFDGAVPSVKITGFSAGDVIDLRPITATTASLGAGNILTLKDAGGNVVATLHFDPAQTFAQPFGVADDLHGGTSVGLIQTSYDVNSAATLDAALAAISQGGPSYAKNFAYSIHFTADISLSLLAAAQLSAINLGSGSTLLIDGAGHTVDGAGTHRGFFDNAGSVTIQNLTIANMLAQGGAGGDGVGGGGGGGAGLGGGLFVAAGASATIGNVVFTHNTAHGGAGGGITGRGYVLNGGGGGGGIGSDGADSGGEQRPTNYVHVYRGGDGGGTGIANLPPGTDAGGKGGSAYYSFYNSTRIKAAHYGNPGGFGGGGGGGAGGEDDDGAIGGGWDKVPGGNGGFGGGGGGGGARTGAYNPHARGGFGGGSGGGFGLYSLSVGHGQFAGGDGGGGLGAGGGIFVQDGGSLTITDGSLSGGSVVGGAAGPNARVDGFSPVASAGQGLGSGIFIQGNQGITLAASSGQTLTVSDTIADEFGYHSDGTMGYGAVLIKGPGIVEFDAANTYVGGTTIDAGATLTLAGQGALGTGAVVNNGTLNLLSGTVVGAAITDNGVVNFEAYNGVLHFSGAVTVAGSFTFGDGDNTVAFDGGLSGSGSINFGSGTQTLKIAGTAPAAVINGFAVGDLIDLTSISATGIGSFVNNVLTLTGAGGATVATIHFDPTQRNFAPDGFRLIADGGGTDLVLNEVPVFQVTTAAQLVKAINQISVGGVFSQANHSYEIDIVGDISLDQVLPNINLASGDTLTIHGLHHTISGAVNGTPTYSGFDLQSGDVTIDHLAMADFVQRGGDGKSAGPHSIQGGGGGGLGAGGALLIAQGASATITDVSFTDDHAIGGNGGNGGGYFQQSTPFGGSRTYQGSDASGGVPHPGSLGAGYGGNGGAINALAGAGGWFGGGGGGGATGIQGLYNSIPPGSGGAGGYGGGNGGQGSNYFGPNSHGGGGGGAGLGGAVFVATGGELNVTDWNFSNNGTAGGAAGSGGEAGQGIGNDLFNYGGTVDLTSTMGQTLTIDQFVGGQYGIFDILGPGAVVLAQGISSGTINISGPENVSILTSLSSGVLNISGSGDVSILDNITAAQINVSGSGNVLLQGEFHGQEVITHTGTGTLTVRPIYNVLTTAELIAAIQAVDSNPIHGLPVNYVINLTASLTLSAAIPFLNIAAGNTLTFEGNGYALDGGNTFGGFYLQSGAATFADVTLQHMAERGGDGGAGTRSGGSLYGGGGGGGGGLGAGGALFVGAGGAATLIDVAVTGNEATGGNGGTGFGGKLSQAGYAGIPGGGGYVNGWSGFGSGGVGGSTSKFFGYSGGFGGGGGGGYAVWIGGAGVYNYHGNYTGSGGGYGAGGGGRAGRNNGNSGSGGGGGGGAGLGGGIFVAGGGSLTLGEGVSIYGNHAYGGAGGSGPNNGGNGVGIGAGLFIASSATVAPSTGQTVHITDAIAGAGSGTLHIGGAGTVVLDAITATVIDIVGSSALVLPAVLQNDSLTVSGSATFTMTYSLQGSGYLGVSGNAALTIAAANNTFSGLRLSDHGTIELAAVNAAGSGPIVFLAGAQATLVIDSGFAPGNEIDGFLAGDTIKLAGFGANATAKLLAGNLLDVTDSTHSIQLHLNPNFDYSSTQFSVNGYAGGVALTDATGPAISVVGVPQNGDQVLVNGVGLPGSTIQVFAAGNPVALGTATPDANGRFTFYTPPFTDGEYTFTAVQTVAGLTQNSAPIVVDVLPMAPTISLAAGSLIAGGQAEVTGVGEPNQIIKLYLDGSATAFATATADGTGNFDFFTPALTEGHHSFRATETDGQGVVSHLSNTIPFDVAPTAPAITTLVGQPLDNGQIELKGTGLANLTIQLFADGGSTVVGTGTTNASGAFDITTGAAFARGHHTLTAVAVDFPNNLTSSPSPGFTVDVDPRAPVITTLVGQPVNGGTVEVKGTTIANGVVTLYDGNMVVGTAVAGGNGAFDLITSSTFTDSVHHLTATVTDPASNLTSTNSASFTVPVKPSVPAIATIDPVAPQTIEIQGTAEAFETITLYADGSTTALASGTVDQFGHFDIVTSILGGIHVIAATETDSASLVSTVSPGVSVNVTPKAPVIGTLFGQPLNGNVVGLGGTGAHVGGTITIYADGGSTVVGSGTIAGNGTFAFNTSVTFADGIHTFTAVETDDGISSAASAAFTVDVNPIAPTLIGQVAPTTPGGVAELFGTGEAGDTVTLSIAGVTVGTGVVDPTGHFDIMVNTGTSSAFPVVAATETDADHLTSTAMVIPLGPAISSVTSVVDAGGRVEVFGTAAAGAVIALFADGNSTVIGSGTADQSGHFDVYSSQGVALGVGPHDITATQSFDPGTGVVTSILSAPAQVSVSIVFNIFTIASAADLATAIAGVDLTGIYSQPNTHYTFNIVGNLQLNAQLPAFNLAAGSSITIEGNGHTLDAHGLPGLFVYAGNVEIDDLSIVNAKTIGGDGYDGGGGGAGLGGGLFIASAGAVTLDNVSFASNQAIGGGSVYAGIRGGGGGGGLGGAGRYGGGGIGLNATGGNYRGAGQGIVVGGASAANNPGNAGGGGGGGGAAADSRFGYGQALSGGGGGGIGSSPGSASAGGAGGFGGGGGGGFYNRYGGVHVASGGDGGFGGGGGSDSHNAYGAVGGVGGFGGGSGVSTVAHPVYVRTAGIVAGGFGAGASYGYSGYGGAGLAAGGAVFVQQGGSLTFAGGGGVSNNQVIAGNNHAYLPAPVSNGSGLGSGFFLQGQQSVTFAPGAGKTITISDAIADMTGSNDHTLQLGAGALVVNGQGTLVLSGANTFTGGIRLEKGTLDVVGAGAGLGAITLVNPVQATLEIDAVNGLLHNAIVVDNFQATAETFVNGVLTLTDGNGGSVSINVINPGANFGSDLHFAIDPVHGTTTVTGGAAAWSNVSGGDWDTSANWSSSAIPTSANDVTIATGASTPYIVSIIHGALFTPGIIPLSSAYPGVPLQHPNIPVTVATVVPAEAEAQAHNLTVNDANATIDDTGILMLSGGLTLNAGTFHLDGGSLQTGLSIDVASGATFGGYGLVSVGGSVSGTVVASASGHTLDFINAVNGTGDFHINAGAALEFGGSVASGTVVTFDGSTGELKLDAPGSFAGTIAGFNGTAADAAHSDVIDLAGIDGNHLTQSSYDQPSGVLTVSDGAHTAHLMFSNFNSSFSFASDGNGGTLVYDPPALPQSTPPNPTAPTGAPAPVALGDNFVFQPGMGAKTIGNFDAQHDAIELDHFAAAQSVAQLASLVSADNHNNALITLDHTDSLTVTGINPQQLLAILSTSVHLH